MIYVGIILKQLLNEVSYLFCVSYCSTEILIHRGGSFLSYRGSKSFRYIKDIACQRVQSNVIFEGISRHAHSCDIDFTVVSTSGRVILFIK